MSTTRRQSIDMCCTRVRRTFSDVAVLAEHELYDGRAHEAVAAATVAQHSQLVHRVLIEVVHHEVGFLPRVDVLRQVAILALAPVAYLQMRGI